MAKSQAQHVIEQLRGVVLTPAEGSAIKMEVDTRVRAKARSDKEEWFAAGGAHTGIPSWVGDSVKKETPPVSELKVTKERVIAAAAKCGDAANVLKELFPEAFVTPKVFRRGQLIQWIKGGHAYTYIGNDAAARDFGHASGAPSYDVDDHVVTSTVSGHVYFTQIGHNVTAVD